MASPMHSAHYLPFIHSQTSSVKMVDVHPITGRGKNTIDICYLIYNQKKRKENNNKGIFIYSTCYPVIQYSESLEFYSYSFCKALLSFINTII
jgi:hypothetical protein